MREKLRLKANDVVLVPLTIEELEDKINHEEDEERKEMLCGILSRCKENTEQLGFCTLWEIIQNVSDGEKVGGIYFMGPPTLGEVEVAFYVERKFKGRGYAVDAIRGMVDWAFARKTVYGVKATVHTENSAAIYSMEKAGFVFRDREEKTEYYSIVKPRTIWTGIYLCVGMAAGCVLGILLNSLYFGFAVGVAVGITLGGSMDIKATKEREEAIGHKLQRKRVG